MPLKIEPINKLTYKLKFTPQMKLSTELLQLPFTKLQEFIKQQLEENPLLRSDIKESPPERINGTGTHSGTSMPVPYSISAGEFSMGKNYNADEQEKQNFKESLITKPTTLHEHLLKQLHLFASSELDCKIGELLIGSIDDNGYLRSSLKEIAESVNTNISSAEKVLSLIQTFDPAGAGARDLRECLLLQLKAEGKEDSLAGRIVDKFLPFLAKKSYKHIASKLKVSEEEVKQALKGITSLGPKPGRSFNNEITIHLIPEAIIQENNHGYEVLFNSELPNISINAKYKQMLIQENTPQDVKKYLKERLKAANLLIEAIAKRKETLRKVIEDIIYTQKDFLDNGYDNFKPMTLQQIAVRIGKHKSTVSRAINNKCVQTPWGILELRHFLNSGIKQKSGKALSSKAVKVKIKKFIAGEDKQKPLNDKQIAKLLNQKKISLSVRTVAKYRNQLKILPSKMRK